MSTTGIIVEFNPFHNGHKSHIVETQKLTGCKNIIAVMSGNFVQRGEPAICNKWHRTKMALQNGVDVVIEIPVPYVISGADYFARASVQLLEATGVVDALSFGSESGNLAEIKQAAEILFNEPASYKETLQNGLSEGLSFAAARGTALKVCMPHATEELFTKPNNCLAMEYVKALSQFNSTMEVLTTHRAAGGPSATAARRQLIKRENVSAFAPKNVQDILDGIETFATLDDFSDILKYQLYTNEKGVAALEEGLGNRLRKMCGEYIRITDLLDAAKTKRYTYTRLQRAALGLILGVSTGDMAEYDNAGGAQYIRILGFRRDAAALIGEITKKASLPVITTGRDIDRILNSGGLPAKMLKTELTAGDIYRIASEESGEVSSERRYGVMVTK